MVSPIIYLNFGAKTFASLLLPFLFPFWGAKIQIFYNSFQWIRLPISFLARKFKWDIFGWFFPHMVSFSSVRKRGLSWANLFIATTQWPIVECSWAAKNSVAPKWDFKSSLLEQFWQTAILNRLTDFWVRERDYFLFGLRFLLSQLFSYPSGDKYHLVGYSGKTFKKRFV